MTSKRVVDLVLVVPGIILLAPILVIIAIWIHLDSPGPVLFLQQRVGLHGRLFNILKFRTMVADAETSGPQITIGVDHRITRSGQFLRKYKLDELPQLFNVLKGDMSLVGPRPEVPRYVRHYPEDAKEIILSVPPGITDPTSIRYRDESDLLAAVSEPERYYVEVLLPKKVVAYQKYVKNRTLIMDLMLIWKTLKSIF